MGRPSSAGCFSVSTALNLFLHDIYHKGASWRNRVVPAALVRSSKHYRLDMRGLDVPHGVYVAVTGTDLIRRPDGKLCGAGGQPARAFGRFVYACQSPGDETRLPQLVQGYGVRALDSLRAGAAQRRCATWLRSVVMRQS
jgi:hypothetical protein